MKEATDNTRLDTNYQNGQSDAEQAMHRRLQSGEALTDEELKNIKLTPGATSTPPISQDAIEAVSKSNEPGSPDTDRVVTPLDVLGG